MKSSHIRRAGEIFDEVADLPEAERSARVHELAAGDLELAGMVMRLLRSDSAAGGFLETPAALVEPSAGPAHELPTRIGRYAVSGIIGEGGMGTVYRAEQEHPRRSVAVKVIRPGATSAEGLARFRREAQLLGSLHHPGIAAIFEAGTAELEFPSGRVREQPFFAMELVRGLPLNDYLAKHSPGLSEKLELFAKICDAADHAHRAGIIHRDLKPGNVLVDTSTEPPTPKVLDFGVARVEHNDANTLRTDAMQLIGTVPYMSPEQISPAPGVVIDARSDVYSLGVMLYQVLSGRLPHDLSNRSLADAARIVRDEEPASLSTTHRAYRGDLATIVARALEKQADRRYASASQLADDIRRSLRHEPISARPPTTLYQLSKFARRNRALVSGIVAAFIALGVGTIVSTVLYLRAEQDRAKAVHLAAEANKASEEASKARLLAERESQKVRAINSYLLEDFIRAAAPTRDGHDVKLLTVLTRAADNLTERFSDQPILGAEIRSVVADALGDVDLRKEAVLHARQAVADLTRELGEDDPRVLEAIAILLNELGNDDQRSEAVTLAREAIERFSKVLPVNDHVVMRCRGILAENLQVQGEYAESGAILVKLLPEMERELGPTDQDTIATMTTMCAVLTATRRHEEAVDLQTKLLENCLASPNRRKPDVVSLRNNLVGGLLKLKRNEEAGLHGAILADEARTIFPEHHLFRSYALLTAGASLQRIARYPEAESAYLEAHTGFMVSRGNGSWEAGRVASMLRDFYITTGTRAQACDWIAATFSHRLAGAADDEGDSLAKGITEATLRLREFDAEAELMPRLLAGADRLAPPNHARRARYFVNLTRACALTDRIPEAQQARETARAALAYSDQPDIDCALLDSITLPQ